MKLLPDSITISWHIDNIKMQAELMGITDLDDHDYRVILSNLKRLYDAEIGINYDVISFAIEFYRKGN